MAIRRISDLVREVKERVKLEDLAPAIGIATVRRGERLRALCPFHDDHDPSLELYDQPGNRHFYCFVCQETGDAIGLAQKKTGLPFVQAVQWLARTHGLERFEPPSTRKRGSVRSQAEPRQGLELALEAYREPPASEVVMNWATLRGLRLETAVAAELGFAAGLRLSVFLNRSGVDANQHRVEEGLLDDAGLLRAVRRPDLAGTAYKEFFRDQRVIFPVRNRGGVLIGLAGRRIDLDTDKASPKYLYTKNMPKGEVLYRSDIVETRLRAIRPGTAPQQTDLYVCEGLVDALRLEENELLAVGLLGATASVKQVQILADWSGRFGARLSLKCHLFLDRDAAGARGVAKLALELTTLGIGCDIVWPTDQQLRSAGVSEDRWKDPDSILRDLQASSDVHKTLSAWAHPAALAVMAHELGVLPEVLLVRDTWETISASRRHRAFTKLIGRSEIAVDLLLDDVGVAPDNVAASWYQELAAARIEGVSHRSARPEFLGEDPDARLNRARALARSGASRGELPPDESGWRRIDVAASGFNEGLKAKLSQPEYGSLEPFDAVFVSRGFEKKEHRLKTMPCPEDLVAQQYVLDELLTELYDGYGSGSFSDCIPAVRYYRTDKRIETTAANGAASREIGAVSFAYQIDMEVLEGFHPAGDQGMFRPYIECWRDFISYLKREASDMPTVHTVRLDLKRYYDSLLRVNVRNVLKRCMDAAFEQLEDSQAWAPLFLSGEQNRDDKTIDWLCDQSFGYRYYDPRDGRVASSPRDVGVPQGPVLSAWLASVSLFPLDAAMSQAVKELNRESKRAAYARYVDDVFLVGDSAQIISVLRSIAEETVKGLSLILVQKGEHYPPMSPDEFGEMLVEGRVAAASGPAVEPPVLHLGDGVTGGLTWVDADLTRASALDLLNDRRNYLMNDEQLHDQLFTALQAKDLRPSELTKVARWIWYMVGKTSHNSAESAWRSYWEIWYSLTSHCKWKLDSVDRPWDDPAFVALEGLDLLFSTAHACERSLDSVEKKEKDAHTLKLAELVLNERIVEDLTITPNSSLGVGSGVRQLPRMFIQRLCGVRWKAFHLSGNHAHSPLWAAPNFAGKPLLWSSLARAKMAECETAACDMPSTADNGRDPFEDNSLRDAFLWMHEAVVSLKASADRSHDSDPLQYLTGRLPELNRRSVEKETSYSQALRRFLQIVHIWSTSESTVSVHEIDSKIRTAALLSFVSVCPAGSVIRLLGKRPALLSNELSGARPLSPPTRDPRG